MRYQNKRQKSLPFWRISVLLLLLLNLLVGCELLQEHTQTQPATAQKTASTVTEPSKMEYLVGRVVRVADGDTVTILDANNTQHRIRLAQIDAPETKQAYSKVSKAALSELIATKEVTVKVDGIDRYKRVLGEIFIANKNVNLYMVRNGYAWAYTQYVTDNSYFKAQEAAQREQLGLWRDPHALEPWEYRKQQRKR